MRLVSQLTLSAVVALGSLAFAPVANAQSLLVGTQDRQDLVFEFRLPTVGTTLFTPLISPTQDRPRGIDYDRTNDDLYVGSGPNPGGGAAYLTVYNQLGGLKRGPFLAQYDDGLGNINALTHLNDVDYHNKKLYVSNAFVYNGSGSADRNLYVYDNPTANNPVARIFGTLDSSVYANNEVWFNGIEFGKDGNLYAVQQTGNSGMGTGYIRRFSPTGTYIDTPLDGTKSGLFGVTFDPSNGDMYFGAGNDIYKKTYDGMGGFGAETLLTPTALDTSMICDVYFATDGYLYAAGVDRHSIFKVNPANGAILTTVGNGLGDPKSDFLSEVFTPAPGLDVPEPGSVAFGVIAVGSVLGLIARKRKA